MSFFQSLFGGMTAGSHRISVAEGKERVAQGAQVVDVRSPAEFASGHLPEAVNIPVSEIAARMAEIPSEHGVVLYCRSGARSSRAATFLADNGYTVGDMGPMPSLGEWKS